MTRLYGVIGDPIDHSLSPVMQTAALRALRLDALYAPFEVPKRFVSPMLRGLVLAGVEGLNVTVPLKEAVVPLMDRLDATARAMGAVNTIVIRDRRMTGCNTDGTGFHLALKELGWPACATRGRSTGGAAGRRPKPCHAVILGAGGAARAVAWELARIPGSRLTVANRHAERARALVRWLVRANPRSCARAVPLREAAFEEADLVVNATTVGMRASDRPLIDCRRLRRGALVYDLVYHRETALVRSARRRGCVAANGLSMLLYQGAESLRLWLRRRPPTEVMRQALLKAVKSGK